MSILLCIIVIVLVLIDIDLANIHSILRDLRKRR